MDSASCRRSKFANQAREDVNGGCPVNRASVAKLTKAVISPTLDDTGNRGTRVVKSGRDGCYAAAETEHVNRSPTASMGFTSVWADEAPIA
jgi:hypothetical protein